MPFPLLLKEASEHFWDLTLYMQQYLFKLKNDKIEEPSVYLGAQISKMENSDGQECWVMSADTYCAAMVQNIELILQKKGLRLPSKCFTPLKSVYRPELDCTNELKADGVHWY